MVRNARLTSQTAACRQTNRDFSQLDDYARPFWFRIALKRLECIAQATQSSAPFGQMVDDTKIIAPDGAVVCVQMLFEMRATTEPFKGGGRDQKIAGAAIDAAPPNPQRLPRRRPDRDWRMTRLMKRRPAFRAIAGAPHDCHRPQASYRWNRIRSGALWSLLE
jgi:hypothetical protein